RPARVVLSATGRTLRPLLGASAPGEASLRNGAGRLEKEPDPNRWSTCSIVTNRKPLSKRLRGWVQGEKKTPRKAGSRCRRGVLAGPDVWCPRGDSNPYDSRRYHLKVVRLPIPPPGHVVR